jgi:hypothetical protein
VRVGSLFTGIGGFDLGRERGCESCATGFVAVKTNTCPRIELVEKEQDNCPRIELVEKEQDNNE